MLSGLGVRLKTQQVLTVFALAAIAAASWYFLIRTEAAMRVMRGDGFFMDLMWMMMKPGEAAAYLGATVSMWMVMMIAMMVPA